MRNKTNQTPELLTPDEIEEMIFDPSTPAKTREGLQRLLNETLRLHRMQAEQSISTTDNDKRYA